MGFTNQTSPYAANGFLNNPPTGGIGRFTTTLAITGFLATPASYGVAVTCYELSGKAYLVFQRMYGAVANVSMDYHTTDGTAVNGVDYTGVSGTISWAAGDISAKVVQVPLKQTAKTFNQYFNFFVDGFYITGNFFHQQLYIFKGGNISPFPGPNYTTSLIPYSFQVTIVRPGNGEADFVGTPYSVTRPGVSTTLTFQVQRFNSFRGAVSVNFHTSDGTAIAGVAYTAISGTLSWADGEGGTKNIVVTILSGGAGTQNFFVTIDTPTGGITIGATNVAEGDIVAAGPPPNPSPGGSVAQQLVDEMGPSTGIFLFNTEILTEAFFGYFRVNLLYGGMFGQKIGSVIGFSGGVPGGTGNGTDPNDNNQTLVPPFGATKIKYAGYVN